jgi:hypothetical protein
MRVVTYSGPSFAADEGVVGKKAEQEWNIGLDTTDTELDERTKHLAPGYFIRGAGDGNLHEQTVVVGLQYASATATMIRTVTLTVI